MKAVNSTTQPKAPSAEGSTEQPAIAWQQVFAALANDELRAGWAQAVLSGTDGLDPKSLAKLRRAGLVREVDGNDVVDGTVFTAALAAQAKPKPTGVDRFFQDGRITGIPRNPDDRDELLGHLAVRLFGVEDVLSEVDVNRLLATVTRDIPTLRRALVDFGFLTRETDGSLYWRSA